MTPHSGQEKTSETTAPGFGVVLTCRRDVIKRGGKEFFNLIQKAGPMCLDNITDLARVSPCEINEALMQREPLEVIKDAFGPTII